MSRDDAWVLTIGDELLRGEIVDSNKSFLSQRLLQLDLEAARHVTVPDEAGEIEAIRAGLETEHGVRVVYSGADMTKPDDIAAMVADAEAALGGVDVLVNNAGIQHVAPVEDFPVDRWDAIMAVNLSAAFHTMHRAVPHMRQHGWGRIVNTASVHGLVASKEKAAYVAAKHGLVGLTKVVALETAGAGITGGGR